jgi:hypothetical protein
MNREQTSFSQLRLLLRCWRHHFRVETSGGRISSRWLRLNGTRVPQGLRLHLPLNNMCIQHVVFPVELVLLRCQAQLEHNRSFDARVNGERPTM